jgi:hypothetical protein
MTIDDSSIFQSLASPLETMSQLIVKNKESFCEEFPIKSTLRLVISCKGVLNSAQEFAINNSAQEFTILWSPTSRLSSNLCIIAASVLVALLSDSLSTLAAGARQAQPSPRTQSPVHGWSSKSA